MRETATRSPSRPLLASLLVVAVAAGCRNEANPTAASTPNAPGDQAAGWHVLVCTPAATPAIEMMASDGASTPWWESASGPALEPDPLRTRFFRFRVDPAGPALPVLRLAAAGEKTPSTLQVMAADGGTFGYMLGEQDRLKIGRRISAPSALKSNMGPPSGAHAGCPVAFPVAAPPGRPLVRAWYVPTAEASERIRQWRLERAAKERAALAKDPAP